MKDPILPWEKNKKKRFTHYKIRNLDDFKYVEGLRSNRGFDSTKRFWSRVKKTKSCWLWQGAKSAGGYGVIGIFYKTEPAHRISYILNGGKINPGLCLDHICRVRHCVNPKHIRQITLIENVMIGNSNAAQNARKTHCKHGHEFTQENTYLLKRPGKPDGRHCKKCTAIRKSKSKIFGSSEGGK